MTPETLDELKGTGPLSGLRIKDRWGVAVEPGFQAVPDVLILRQGKLGLSSEELNVLLNLTLHWWREDDVVFPRTATIAQRMGVSLRSVQRATKSLEKKGLVKRQKTGDGKTYYDLKPLRARLQLVASKLLEEREGISRKQKSPSGAAEAFEAA
ncbi:helix-turn-helix domain-containing protein [Mesorhizobium sp.]|uniref:helix-turn-helix domain-containing protein n=1 Tax=Mesorhizobium sp. TaxID=1871066 RepID=UPI000FE43BB8|nr:helix-turn-helix domain-containing protein [Mesorhizobium sp.]RWQ14144.1 MAG: helix-turn-helix domain-containing protein [Mesorhizobium sp.]